MVIQQIKYGQDLNVKAILPHCPTKEEIDKRIASDKPFVNLVVNMVKDLIKTTTKIIVKEAFLPSLSSFGQALFEVANLFKDDPNIIVQYSKPEDKEKNVYPQFLVINQKLVEENAKKDEITNKLKK